MKKILFTAATLIALIAGVSAQVNIGSTDDPQPFSILELEGHGERGLRLPQLNESQQQALTVELTGLTDQAKRDAARGLQIFNTKTRCVETWNGSKWIAVCGGPDPWVEPDVITGCKYNGADIVIPPVRFAKFNLGADPTLDTPKKQMKYLAEKTYADLNERMLDATVNGGLYQWGRKWDKTSDDTSYPVSVSGTYKRYYGSGDHAASRGSGATYDDNTATNTGQILTYDGTNPADGKYIYIGNTDPYDWRGVANNQKHDLWGNGQGFTGQTDDKGGVFYNEKYYQNTDWHIPSNDPCPDGFRVPTQDELERLGNYDCNPEVASYFGNITVSGTPTGKGLTWVSVVCNRSNSGRCVPDNADRSSYANQYSGSGHAIYKTAEWEAAINTGVYKDWDKTINGFNIKVDGNYKYPSLHEESTAPEPLLFLPAAGWRDCQNGNISWMCEKGFYWSSTVNDKNARGIELAKSGVNSSISPRAYGFSVRCVAE
jgi:hypothetical protein